MNSNILRLYAVTDGSSCLIEKCQKALNSGVTCLQYRAPTTSNAAEAQTLLELCRKHGVPFIINNDVELAKAIGADGVHLGQSDMPVLNARTILGPDAIIGASASTLKEALRAEHDGADYLGVGAMFPTQSKTDAVSVSLSTLRSICTSVSIPTVAIGGIHAGNLHELSHTGIVGIAVISAIFSSGDLIPSSVARLEQVLRSIDFTTPAHSLFLVDFDGTMIDSMSIWATLATDFLMSFGKTPHPDLGEKLTNWGLRDGIIYLREAYNLPCNNLECLTRFTNLLVDRYRACSLKPGVRELADFAAHNSNILLRCATAGSADAVTKVLDTKGLLDYYCPVTSTTEIGIDKSNPDFYLRMLELYGASLRTSCVIDDAPFALQAAHAAGLQTIRIRDPFWASFSDDIVPADQTFDSILDFLNKKNDDNK